MQHMAAGDKMSIPLKIEAPPEGHHRIMLAVATSDGAAQWVDAIISEGELSVITDTDVWQRYLLPALVVIRQTERLNSRG